MKIENSVMKEELEEISQGIETLFFSTNKHGVDSLASIIMMHENLLSDARQKNAIYPFNTIAYELNVIIKTMFENMHQVVDKVTDPKNKVRYKSMKMDGGLEFYQLPFQFYFDAKDIIATYDLLEDKCVKLSREQRKINNKEKKAHKRIKIDVLDSDLGEEFRYLAQGYFIIPQKNGYSITKFSYENDSETGNLMSRTETDNNRVNTVEQALNKIPDSLLCSKVVARNTEEYPIIETALPIVQRKYEELMFNMKN